MSWGLKDDPGWGAVAGDRGQTRAARRPAVGELGLKDDPRRGAVAGDRGRTLAARRPAVGGYGDERQPWSGRCGRGPRASSCGSAARSGWVRRGTTTLVGALWPGTEGELLRLSGPQ